MGREYEPTVGQWYEDLENDETFQVLKVDEDREVVEIQHLDGDIEELDVEDWAELDLELSEEPEGWSGSKAERDAEEEEDEDEDDGTMKTTRMMTRFGRRRRRGPRGILRARPCPRLTGRSDPLEPAVPVGRLSLLNGHQLRRRPRVSGPTSPLATRCSVPR